jgi:DivIVA domain-containing protein
MPILPEEIATATFTRVHRQGYHTGEVEAFLQTVAADYSAALEKLLLTRNESPEIDVGEEVNNILSTARASANSLVQKAQEEAAAIEKAITERAQALETQTSEARAIAFQEAAKEAKAVRDEADRYANELRNRTEAETRHLMATAEIRARQLHAYNHQLSDHLEEIERLVIALRKELDSSAEVWPDGQPADAPVANPKERMVENGNRPLLDERV